MLKFLTNKLKNHSINDEPSLHVNPPNHHQFKDNEEHDSGTESDDEQQINLEELEEVVMENEMLDRSSASTTSPGLTICSVPSPYFLDSALASDSDINNDHHSSEEELEVINSSPKGPVQSRNASRCGNLSVNLRSASVNALPEKRKWSEINLTNLGSVGKLNRLCLTPGTRIDQSSGSSDDEVQGFLTTNMGTPVKFRSSPPLDVVKPGKSLSPPPKLFNYEVSSRKRHRHMHKPHHLQRPCLDFEKMQQLKARAVTAWRHNGDHGGELSVFCRSLAEPQVKNAEGRNIQIRPKSEKFRGVTSAKNSEPSATNFIQKNLDNYILSLSNFELKQKLESCPGTLVECPVLNDFREGLKKSISNHVSLTSRTESRCRTHPTAKDRDENKISNMSKAKSNSEDQNTVKTVKTTTSNTSRAMIRSTRAQDLRSQSNRDLLKPKTTNEKTRTTSPYVTAMPQKKKKLSSCCKSDPRPRTKFDDKKMQSGGQNLYKDKIKKEKSSSAGEEISLQRQKTQEIIHPKIVKKSGSSQTTIEGDFEPPQLKKSQTFFICKGAKNGDGDNKSKTSDEGAPWGPQNDSPSDEDDLASPKPKPLTHNDSFCLIVKSSQNWSQKNRSDDEKWIHYGLTYEEKTKKNSDKGILKNSNYDLKSVDSLEKVDSEKIVRFSDELLKNKKVLKKLVRRKKRLQNFITPNWYQKNKLFQKYLEILREKSVLLSDQNDTSDDLKPFRVPIQVKERYEAEMFGLYPRKGKFSKNRVNKDASSY